MRKLPFTLLFAIVIASLPGCRRGEPHDTLPHRLDALDEAIGRQAQGVFATIDSGMSHAGDSITWYAYYARLCKYYYCSPTPDSLLPVAERTIDFVRRAHPATRDDSLRLNGVAAVALECKANYLHYYRHQADTVMLLHQEAYRRLLDSDAASKLPEVCGNIADCYTLHNRCSEATAWYRRALVLADSLHSSDAVLTSLNVGLGRTYQFLNDMESARTYFLKAGTAYHRLPMNMRIFYLTSLGNYHYYNHDYRAADTTFRHLEALLDSLGARQSLDMSLCKVNQADVSLNLGDTRRARQLVEEVKPKFEEVGLVDGLYYCNAIGIGIAVREHRLDEAARLADEPQEAHPEQGLVDIRNRYLLDFLLAAGRQERALALQMSIKRHNDSVGRDREHMRAAENIMRMSEDTLRLHHQVVMAHSQARLTHMRWALAACAAAVLLLLLALALRAAHTRKQRVQSELDTMRLRIDGVRQRITPHFVFNVLTHRLLDAGSDESAEIRKLVRLIRANLDIAQHTIVTLKDELDFVRRYVDVEQEMIDGLHYTVTTSPTTPPLDQIVVPSMFVQILVENSIKHGLKGLDREKSLEISVDVHGHVAQITVADNGRGFECRAAGTGSTGTGLNIIRQTMQLINKHSRGERMTLDFIRTDGAGCKAVLHIPQNIQNLDLT